MAESKTVFMNWIIWSGDVALAMDAGEPRTFFVMRCGVVRQKSQDLPRALELYHAEVGRCAGCGG